MRKRSSWILAAGALWLCGNSWTMLASTQDFPVRLTVLRVEATGQDEQQAPIDCNMQTYSAYCNSSRSNATANVMVVQDTQGNAFSITCGNVSQWLAAGCRVLPAGATYNARIAQNKVAVQYMTTKGKLKTANYELVVGSEEPAAATATTASSALGLGPRTAPAAVATAARCSFTSLPDGADIVVDGKFVGSTPSALPLAPGDHSITVKAHGYADWQRDLTVAPGSDLTVHSVLQKQ